MNHHPNGTISIGAPNSYANILSGLEDLLKGKPKVFEVRHMQIKLIEAGEKAGLSREQMESDWRRVSQ